MTFLRPHQISKQKMNDTDVENQKRKEKKRKRNRLPTELIIKKKILLPWYIGYIAYDHVIYVYIQKMCVFVCARERACNEYVSARMLWVWPTNIAQLINTYVS